MNFFITGIDGFIGSYLAELLLENSESVWGLIRHDSISKNIEPIETMLNLIEGDLLDLEALESIIRSVNPDVIIHLAGQALYNLAIDRPHQTMQTNVLGSLNVLEAVRKHSPKTRVVMSISCDIHGKIDSNKLPVDENTSIDPQSPLAASHATTDMITRQYAKTYDMNIVIARILALVGPRQSKKFVISEYAHKIVRAKLGMAEKKIVAGKLTAERDLIDVRDAVRAMYILASNQTKHNIYTICSGQRYKLRDLLDKLMEIADVDYPIEVETERIRNADVPLVIGSPKRLLEEFDFKPRITIEQSLLDVYRYWFNTLERNEF